MKLTLFQRTASAVLFTVAVLTSVNASAKDGRDFAGHYSLTSVTDKGSEVELQLALQLFNYSGADLKQAVVTVRESAPKPGVVGTFAPIKLWHNGKDIVVKQQVTISQEEFRRWTSRGQPAVFIGYRNEEGRPTLRFAQLSRSPIIQQASHEVVE